MKRLLTLCMTIICAMGMSFTVYADEPKQESEAQMEYIEPTEYIPVLMYHHFIRSDVDAGNGVTMSKNDLEEDIAYFVEQGYHIISLEELDEILAKEEKRKDPDGDNGLDLHVKYMCITMDDGYFSNYLHAYPVFRQYNVPASIFLITDSVTNQTGVKKLTWEHVKEMAKNSRVRVYNHTANHVPADQTTTEDFVDAALAAEEALDERVAGQRSRTKALAFPNGKSTPEIREALLDEGFSMLFTVEQNVINRDTTRDAIPRIMISSGLTGEEVVKKIEQTASRTMSQK